MKSLVIVAVLIFMGCGVQEQTLLENRLPQLILQDPLPPVVSRGGIELRIDLRLLIDKSGKVAYAELVSPAVDPTWDSLAREIIYRWKFSPAIVNGTPVRIWIRFPAIVRFAEPKIMELAEIVCDSRAVADSLYAILSSGGNFEEIAKRFSGSESAAQGGYLGKVNIRRYPDEVQKVLSRLKEKDITPPIKLGNRYIILKGSLLTL